MDTNERPIGIFDSGIGGLTVAREIMNHLPGENLVYFGDTARVPYGSKSKETITRFAFEGVNFLMKQAVKMIVIACNTVSATCLDELQQAVPVPVVGVIEPGARAAVNATVNGVVGVIGTERTINSGAYIKAIHRLNSSIKIFSRACPMFVPLVEEGWLDNEAAVFAARTYLGPLKKEGIDTLVLACTHYPLLKPTLRKVMGDQVFLVDSAMETAREVARLLREKSLARTGGGPATYRYFVSDNPAKFKEVGERFLNRSIDPISVIDPETGAGR
ncbi:glutamate racemase [Thermosediminibacter oceani]|uniref:Glutamate racemase n=1 Tax=Thermosediminibacter oceani (strain ATCC BAA-1034 / DSM 16646 / JW/IW-1228P) TaxID=555079 RepID=D9S129_THEOJ|nr:glutamate racemase [Thermosediminibacter oceani]ADL08908.1 glutamate racemase [Thermosediminibacter oceani DSM 16646]